MRQCLLVGFCGLALVALAAPALAARGGSGSTGFTGRGNKSFGEAIGVRRPVDKRHGAFPQDGRRRGEITQGFFPGFYPDFAGAGLTVVSAGGRPYLLVPVAPPQPSRPADTYFTTDVEQGVTIIRGPASLP